MTSKRIGPNWRARNLIEAYCARAALSEFPWDPYPIDVTEVDGLPKFEPLPEWLGALDFHEIPRRFDPPPRISLASPSVRRAVAAGPIIGRGAESVVREAVIATGRTAGCPGRVAAALRLQPLVDRRAWARFRATPTRRAATNDRDAEAQVLAEYGDPENRAYVGVSAAMLGSRLVEENRSPFHPLLYGAGRLTESPNGPPLQASVVQRLDGDLISLAAAGALDDPVAEASAFFQVVFGLAQAQRAFGLVSNDVTAENVLYQRVPEDDTLYYSVGDRFFAVPTHGLVLKLSDLTLASFALGPEGPTVTSAFWRPYGDAVNPRGSSTDALAAVREILFRLRSGRPRTDGGLVDSVILGMMGCGDGLSIAAIARSRCAGLASAEGSDALSPCLEDALTWEPTRPDTTCVNGEPSRWLSAFAPLFGVEPGEIPSGAIVYRLLPDEVSH